ncbi:MAG: 16S rRNA (cytosine(1402)-N(4))-methyltransferase RsmH [Candidatus Omnitrophota bacterium]
MIHTHIPVLANEVAQWLHINRGGIFFDGTIGLGGHSEMMLTASPDNVLYGTDKDPEALAFATQRLEPFTGRFTFFHSDYKNLESLPIDIRTIDGFLFDLGVSSFQLDTPEKGFSFSKDAPLDMRMDKTQTKTAYDVVNHYTHNQLSDVLKHYGEFDHPERIIDQIVALRKQKKIETTEELKTIIRRICPKQKTMDPLARIFQAIRIEVNDELTGLESFFQSLIEKMKPGSRIAIISFHSLEDRVVKTVFKEAKEKNQLQILTKKPLIPQDKEQESNPRSRSAKLRVGEKIPPF